MGSAQNIYFSQHLENVQGFQNEWLSKKIVSIDTEQKGLAPWFVDLDGLEVKF